MSDITAGSGPVKWLPRPQYAKQRGVHSRTVKRWEDAGRISKPKVVNGRAYHRADEEPRTDGEVVA
jgi:predicted site-specific integrase-resolvase